MLKAEWLPTGMHWTDDKLRYIIAQHAPVLCLHKEEKYLPCSVEWYMDRSELWLQQPNESSQVKLCSTVQARACSYSQSSLSSSALARHKLGGISLSVNSHPCTPGNTQTCSRAAKSVAMSMACMTQSCVCKVGCRRHGKLAGS